MSPIINISVFGLLLGIVIVFAWIAIYYKDKYTKTQDEFLNLADKRGFFSKKSSIMRRDERTLFNILIKWYGETYYIFPQVRLAEVLDIKNDVKDHDNLFRVIDHRSLDFVLFDKTNIAPLVAIELNGASHQMYNRRNRDEELENLLTHAGIHFIAFGVDRYDEQRVKRDIDALLTTTTS